jgi:hypothetical protein
MTITLNQVIANLTLEDALEWELTDEKFIHVTDYFLDRNDLPRSMRAVDRIEARFDQLLTNHGI